MVKLFPIILAATLGAQGTRWLVIRKGFSPIRASSLLTLIVIGILHLTAPGLNDVLSAAVLGGTFVGMNDTQKLSARALFHASVLFSFVFYFVLPWNQGLGGALGFAALVSSIVTHAVAKKITYRNKYS